MLEILIIDDMTFMLFADVYQILAAPVWQVPPVFFSLWTSVHPVFAIFSLQGFSSRIQGPLRVGGAICGWGGRCLWVRHCVVLEREKICFFRWAADKIGCKRKPLLNITSTFLVGLPFGFMWRRALALVRFMMIHDDLWRFMMIHDEHAFQRIIFWCNVGNFHGRICQ